MEPTDPNQPQDTPEPFQQQPPPQQPPPGQPFQQQPPPQAYGQPGMQPGVPMPGMAMAYPEQSQAVLSLVMSLVGLVVCGGVLCPVGWYYGNKELQGIDAGLRDPSKRDLAMAGKIIGIIGTVLVVLAIVSFIGFIFLAVILGSSG